MAESISELSNKPINDGQAIIELSTDATGSATNGNPILIFPAASLPQSMSTPGVIVVNMPTMLETSNFRSHNVVAASNAPVAFQTLANGRISPSYQSASSNSYATLTPLQPLPPISTVAEKFGQPTAVVPQAIGPGFTFIQNNGGFGGADLQNCFRYNMNVSAPSVAVVDSNGYAQAAQVSAPYSISFYDPNTLLCQKMEDKPSQNLLYEAYTKCVVAAPNIEPAVTSGSDGKTSSPSFDGLGMKHEIVTQYTMRHHSLADNNQFQSISSTNINENEAVDSTTSSRHDFDELNTKDLAQRISNELKRYSIPQAVFAQKILCRSQGTLSDLLRNPKPWSKLKSGRETFKRMWKWLQEPEEQRLATLKLLGASLAAGNVSTTDVTLGAVSTSGMTVGAGGAVAGGGGGWFMPMSTNGTTDSGAMSPASPPKPAGVRRKEETVGRDGLPIKKPRLVFTDIQRRTLMAIFKETQRPSKDMQMTIADQLGLKVSTVANFFMNARRRSLDKYRDDSAPMAGGADALGGGEGDDGLETDGATGLMAMDNI